MSIKSLAKIIASRLFISTGGLDAKRPRAWCEYGFPESLGFDDFYRAYQRVDLAHGAVQRTVEKCWQSDPWVIEGDPTRDEDKTTPTEAAWARLFKDLELWARLRDADRRRLVGRHSGILLYFADNQTWDQPMRGTARLARIEPIWANQFKVETWYEDETDADLFGLPRTYSYTQSSFGEKQSKVITVHADRLFVLGNIDSTEPAFLEPGYNQLVNLEKISGGSGESILKNAARQIGIEFNDDAEWDEDSQEAMDQKTRDLSAGVDASVAVQGGAIKLLTTNPVDPTGPFTVASGSFAASVIMPVKILIGMQTGERASTEDKHDWNARCQGRRINRLTPDILHFLQHLRRLNVLVWDGEISVVWDDLRQASRADQLADAKTMAETNVMGISTGAPYYSDKEVREAGGFDGEVNDAE